MSQADNAAATSSKPKRAYRKGNPLTAAEKQKLSVERKKATHKILTVHLPNERKDELQLICSRTGMTQAEVLGMLIENAMLEGAWNSK